MPSQPKIDLAKLRSQISRRVDNSFPVFARLVWHAGHEIGMPSVTDFDVRSSIISWESHNRQIYLRELEVTGFKPGNKCRLWQVMFIIMYVTGSTGKTEDRSFEQAGFINKNHNKTTLFMHKIEYLTCNQRSISPFISNRWHFWVQI